MNELRNRKAISPVIATVILVAVAITIAVAVSYWMSGIAGQYTKFEKIEIQSGYSAQAAAVAAIPASNGPDGLPGTADDIPATPASSGGWIITLELKNSGSAPASLIKVFVNDKPVNLYGTTFITGAFSGTNSLMTGTNIPDTGLAIESGKTAIPTVQVYIGSGLFSSGTTIDIKIHSANGMDYIKLIGLA